MCETFVKAFRLSFGYIWHDLCIFGYCFILIYFFLSMFVDTFSIQTLTGNRVGVKSLKKDLNPYPNPFFFKYNPFFLKGI